MTAHIGGYQSCAAFAKRHQTLDVTLASSFAPPSLGLQSRARLRRDIRRDRLARWYEWLPDVMHVIGCSVAVSIYVTLTPGDAPEAMVRGLAGSLIAYSAISIARTWLEDTYS